MKDLTMVVAHPDDEVIFGSCILDRTEKIVCISSDKFNPEREWCKNRKFALREVGQLLGIEVVCFDYNSEFYKMDARKGELMTIAKEIEPLVAGQTVFTHNSWGEYGHVDHILTSRIVQAMAGTVYTTDICIQSDWIPVAPNREGEILEVCKIDLKLYAELEEIYRKYGCWTWNKPPVETVNLIQLARRF